MSAEVAFGRFVAGGWVIVVLNAFIGGRGYLTRRGRGSAAVIVLIRRRSSSWRRHRRERPERRLIRARRDDVGGTQRIGGGVAPRYGFQSGGDQTADRVIRRFRGHAV